MAAFTNFLWTTFIWCIHAMTSWNTIHTLTSFNNTEKASEVTVTVSIQTDVPMFVTDERVLSVGLAPHLIRHHFKTFNLTSQRVLTLGRALSPAYLRFSGTDADRMIYTGNITSRNGTVFPFPLAGFNMTSRDWNRINRYVNR